MANYNSIAEFNQALANAKTLMPATMLIEARSAIAKLALAIKTRVSTKGETMDGGSFTAYSRGHKYKKTMYGNPPLGKKIDKKNFFYSGYMWSTFGIRNISIQGDRIVSEIDFAGHNVYAMNTELNEFNSEYDYGKNDKKGLSYPNKQEEVELVAEIEKALFESLSKVL